MKNLLKIIKEWIREAYQAPPQNFGSISVDDWLNSNPDVKEFEENLIIFNKQN